MAKKDLVKETINLYQSTGWKRWFVRLRFWDAPYEEIEKLVPKKGKIVDLGCGEGIFTNYLALGSKKRELIGIEIDEGRVKDADKGLENTRFIHGDALKRDFPKADVILMIHLLHHLPSHKSQKLLIGNCVKKLKKGGRLIIAEVDQKPIVKYLISWLTDAFVVPILFERRLFNFSFFYRSESEWKRLLTKYGFTVNASGVSRGKPFSHVVFEARL